MSQRHYWQLNYTGVTQIKVLSAVAHFYPKRRLPLSPVSDPSTQDAQASQCCHRWSADYSSSSNPWSWRCLATAPCWGSIHRRECLQHAQREVGVNDFREERAAELHMWRHHTKFFSNAVLQQMMIVCTYIQGHSASVHSRRLADNTVCSACGFATPECPLPWSISANR